MRGQAYPLVLVEGGAFRTAEGVQGEHSRSVPHGGAAIKPAAVVLVPVEALLVARVACEDKEGLR